MHTERRINFELAVRKAKPLPIRTKLLSRKLFENVNSLFANESEFVIVDLYLNRRL